MTDPRPTWRRVADALIGPSADVTVWLAVLGGWAAATAWMCGFVYRHGVDCPVADEWFMLRGLVGEQPLWSWLWERHNEHLYPLPRLIWWTVLHVFGLDFRSGMWCSATILSAAALVLLHTARRHRGRSRPVDLLIPALLMHDGHYELTLVGYDLCLSLPILLAAAFLAVAVKDGFGVGRFVLVAAIAVALALCGGMGTMLAPLVAGWCALAAWRSGRRWLLVSLSAALFLGTTVYLACYTLNAPRGAPAFTGVTPQSGAVEFSEYLGGSVGIWGHGTWGEWSLFRLWPFSAVIVGLIVFGALGLLARRWLTDPAERVRATALAAVILVGLAVGGGIVAYRPGVNFGFCVRYAAPGAMMICAAHLAWARYGRWPLGWWGNAVALLLAVGIEVVAARTADPLARNVFKHHQEALGFQSQAGKTPEGLTRDTASWLLVPGPLPDELVPTVGDGLVTLRRHRIGCYRWMREANP